MTQACGKLKTPQPEESCNFQQNSYKQRVSWHKLPVKLYAHTSLSAEQVQALQEAIQIWNKSRAESWQNSQEFFELVESSYAGDPVSEDGKSVVSVNSDWQGDGSEQAVTVLRWESNRISDADIKLNGDKPLSSIVPLSGDQIDLVALYVHELGHVLGLLHIESAEYTVMDFELDRGNDQRRTPGNLELNALKCEY